jgi:hypothetical protein
MANGKYGKRDQRNADLARQFEETKRDGERKLMERVRCRACKEAKKPIYIEMGGFVFCGDCIEAAAQIVAERKGRP